MSSVILMFTLLAPTFEDAASELSQPETTEPYSDAIARMLAKYDAEYEVEQALERFNTGLY
ncbi:hypothetical protein PPSIR1_10195 [Plesiocystis pacifica SIR-1]|uniref:Uncharacterized protein n=1 Tax=Plesiocystis pacifica SIR-1 TaxID=391625 RepID=A6GJ73_9BACT|nr:hypothetical protein [Plesiocystis pacifica]EDM74081.1 hypothetical protein PPSIR1_10195 [Plesiocystis pacifica SIR-1]